MAWSSSATRTDVVRRLMACAGALALLVGPACGSNHKAGAPATTTTTDAVVTTVTTAIPTTTAATITTTTATTARPATTTVAAKPLTTTTAKPSTAATPLQRTIDNFAAKQSVPFSVVAIDLTTGNGASHLPDRQVLSASLYKLFVARASCCVASMPAPSTVPAPAGDTNHRTVGECLGP